MTPEEKARKQKLQASLEQTTDYVFETGDVSILDSPKYKEIRAELVKLLQAVTVK